MLLSLSWDADINGVPTSFALAYDDAARGTTVASVTQTGAPGSVIIAEVDDTAEIDLKITLGDRQDEVLMLLARATYSALFGNESAPLSPQPDKLLLTAALKARDISTIKKIVCEFKSRNRVR